MMKTITVKGIGKATAKPDLIVISMALDSQDMEYEKAMEKASDSIVQINSALAAAGFDKEEIKTTNFNVHSDYRSVRDSDGSYRQEFNGYVVSHNLKIQFDFDVRVLSNALRWLPVTPSAINRIYREKCQCHQRRNATLGNGQRETESGNTV